jgi:hypothetical protein
MLEVRPKKELQAKWNFEGMLSLIHSLLKYKGQFNIFQATANDFSYNFFFLPINISLKDAGKR